MRYFSILELCVSGSHPNLVEKPAVGTQPYKNLVYLIERLLDPVRERLGQPMRVTSGYRPERLNKAVGGSPTSNHKYGSAADVMTGRSYADNLKIVDALLETGLEYDECIVEGARFDAKGKLVGCQWVHLAKKPSGNRGKFIYTADFKTYHPLRKAKSTVYSYSK